MMCVEFLKYYDLDLAKGAGSAVGAMSLGHQYREFVESDSSGEPKPKRQET